MIIILNLFLVLVSLVILCYSTGLVILGKGLVILDTGLVIRVSWLVILGLVILVNWLVILGCLVSYPGSLVSYPRFSYLSYLVSYPRYRFSYPSYWCIILLLDLVYSSGVSGSHAPPADFGDSSSLVVVFRSEDSFRIEFGVRCEEAVPRQWWPFCFLNPWW